MIRERTSALHVRLIATDHSFYMRNHAPNPQCNKCSRYVMIIVAGKVATAMFSMFTKKINYLLCISVGQL